MLVTSFRPVPVRTFNAFSPNQFLQSSFKTFFYSFGTCRIPTNGFSSLLQETKNRLLIRSYSTLLGENGASKKITEVAKTSTEEENKKIEEEKKKIEEEKKKIEATMDKIEEEKKKINDQMATVKAEGGNVEKTIVSLMEQVRAARPEQRVLLQSDLEYWRAKEAELWAEKARLDAEKTRLDAEKADLRAKEARLDAEKAKLMEKEQFILVHSVKSVSKSSGVIDAPASPSVLTSATPECMKLSLFYG